MTPPGEGSDVGEMIETPISPVLSVISRRHARSAHRPRKFADGARRDRLLAVLAAGVPRSHACAAVGVSRETFYNQLQRDAGFANAVEEAEGRAVAQALTVIHRAASEGTWQAAAWFLERRYPAEFSRRTILAGADERATEIRFTLDIARGAGGGAD